MACLSRCRRARALPLLLLLAWLPAVLAAQPEAAHATWFEAIGARDADAVGRLLDANPGLDVNRAPEHGTTALMVVAKSGRMDLVERLLAAGASARQRTRSGGSALMFAVQSGEVAIASRLLRAGAAVNATADNGWSALTVAAALGDEAMVRRLLETGGDPLIRDVYGWTALMRAADNGHPAAGRALIQAGGSDLPPADDAGMTALHHAARRGLVEIVRLLTAAGAPTEARDLAGRTPAALAAGAARQAVLAALSKE